MKRLKGKRRKITAVFTAIATMLTMLLPTAGIAYADAYGFTSYGDAVEMATGVYKLAGGGESLGTLQSNQTYDASAGFTITFDYYIDTSTGSGNADGISVMITDSQPAYDYSLAGGYMGLVPNEDMYAIELDGYYNGAFNDQSASHIALMNGDQTNHVMAVDCNQILDGQVHTLSIYCDTEIITASIDGIEYINSTDAYFSDDVYITISGAAYAANSDVLVGIDGYGGLATYVGQNYTTSATGNISEWLGTWEGEYDGLVGSTVVKRHFFMTFDSYTDNGDGTYQVDGIFTFKESEDADQAAISSESGSYYRTGTVNISERTITNLNGNGWIEQPSGFSYCQFTSGTLNDSGTRIEGTTENGTYWCDKVSGLTSQTSVSLYGRNSSSAVDILNTSYSIAANSDETCTIIASSPESWNGSSSGSVNLMQNGEVKMASKTGAFLDIVPGQIFDVGVPIVAAFLDSDDNVVKQVTTMLSITGEGTTPGNYVTENLIENGDAEAMTIDPWWNSSYNQNDDFTAVNSATRSSGETLTPHGGNAFFWSGSMTKGYMAYRLDVEDYPVGTTFYLTAWADDRGTENADINLAFVDDENNLLLEDYDFNSEYGWKQLSITMQMPKDSVTLVIYLDAGWGTDLSGEEIAFDDVVLTADTSTATGTTSGGSYYDYDSDSDSMSKGDTFWTSAGKFKVTGKSTCTFVCPIFEHNKKTYTVPNTAIGYDDLTYKVTGIGGNAFDNVKNYVTKLIIGKNVKTIGKKAFYGCKKLKSIIIKSKKLKMSKVGAKAFGKINKKCVAKVPKDKYKQYKKMLKKKGFNLAGQKIKK